MCRLLFKTLEAVGGGVGCGHAGRGWPFNAKALVTEAVSVVWVLAAEVVVAVVVVEVVVAALAAVVVARAVAGAP